MRIVIINYGMGNLKSVYNAFHAIKCNAVVINSPKQIEDADFIVLPGVGSFGDGITNLLQGDWIPAMKKAVIENKTPFLGICLGMQLLATQGTEHGVHQGLNWIPGKVKKLNSEDPTIRIPHIGWNNVTPSSLDNMYGGLSREPCFYFLHSYAFHANDPSMVNATCEYGDIFAASIAFKNIWGVQFHPEKSQRAGLQVLTNFIKNGFGGKTGHTV